MNRDNPFDELFKLGTRDRTWTDELISDFMNDAGPFDPDDRLQEGRRVEIVDGERREYELNDDGEWERINDDGLFTITETDDGYEWTVDMSRILPTGEFDVSATMNNGVLNVTFESEDE